jgi:hypothetical protein
MPITGETCVYPIDGTVDPLTLRSLMDANVAAMGISDWAALLFATCVAALAVVGELKVRQLVCSLTFLSRISRSTGFVRG